MPLDKGTKCEAFWKNVKELQAKFEKDSDDPKAARKRAVAVASRTFKDNGGDPSKCIDKGTKDAKTSKEANSDKGDGKKEAFGGKKAPPFGKKEE